jgi:hypothetical protein
LADIDREITAIERGLAALDPVDPRSFPPFRDVPA